MMRSNSAGRITRPDGLLGEFRMISRVREVTASRTMSAVKTKSLVSVSMGTDLPRAKLTISGKVTQ